MDYETESERKVNMTGIGTIRIEGSNIFKFQQ